MKNDVINCCKDGKCFCCGGCCSDYIPWTKKEIIRVAEYLKEHPEIKEQYKNLSQGSFKALCAFNDETTHRCLIYPVRPDICKTFCCNKPSDFIDNNRDKHLRNAYVNGLNPNNIINGMGKLCSTHALFFKNVEWDKIFIKTYASIISSDNQWAFQKACDILFSFYDLQYVVEKEEK